MSIADKFIRLFIKETELKPADYLVVLNGSLYDRACEAADLYKEGFGKKILFSGDFQRCGYDTVREMGIPILSDAQVNAEICKKKGVQSGDVILVPENSFGTHAEALSVYEYLKEHPVQSIILVTSHIHSRRTYMTFKRVLKKIPVTIMSKPTRYDHLDIRNWWNGSWEKKWVFWELLKLIYYYFRY